MSFDYNKLVQHKKYMEENDISSMVFGDLEHQFGNDGEVYYLDNWSEDLEKWVENIENEDWEEFKIEVANYFLQEV